MKPPAVDAVPDNVPELDTPAILLSLCRRSGGMSIFDGLSTLHGRTLSAGFESY